MTDIARDGWDDLRDVVAVVMPEPDPEPDDDVTELVLELDDVDMDNPELGAILDAALSGQMIGGWELHRVENGVQYWRLAGNKSWLVRREIG